MLTLPAARDAFKRATDARAAWLACSAAILDSIGESNRLAISDPEMGTLHLSPRDIINAMTARYGGTDGCRRLASASKEKTFSTC
jgi:hypothetical protein